VVRLEAVVLPDQSKVAIAPPTILPCSMAEAIVRWVREEAAPCALELGSPLRSVSNLASFYCRGRNGIAGAKLSEHGKANALTLSCRPRIVTPLFRAQESGDAICAHETHSEARSAAPARPRRR
jgi:hypothetical protein